MQIKLPLIKSLVIKASIEMRNWRMNQTIQALLKKAVIFAIISCILFLLLSHDL